MARFLDESGAEDEVTARRHGMFKIIPRIEKGGWVLKQAVGQNTPVLLGKKLTTKYFRSSCFLFATSWARFHFLCRALLKNG